MCQRSNDLVVMILSYTNIFSSAYTADIKYPWPFWMLASTFLDSCFSWLHTTAFTVGVSSIGQFSGLYFLLMVICSLERLSFDKLFTSRANFSEIGAPVAFSGFKSATKLSRQDCSSLDELSSSGVNTFCVKSLTSIPLSSCWMTSASLSSWSSSHSTKRWLTASRI